MPRFSTEPSKRIIDTIQTAILALVKATIAFNYGGKDSFDSVIPLVIMAQNDLEECIKTIRVCSSSRG